MKTMETGTLCLAVSSTTLPSSGAALIHDPSGGTPSPLLETGGPAVAETPVGWEEPPLTPPATPQSVTDSRAAPHAHRREAGATRVHSSWQETKLAGNTRCVFH